MKPALALLHQKEFAGAEAEFLSAHEHYRHGKAKEALTDCLKALESTMKAIANKRKWPYDPKSTAKTLVDVMFREGLVPQFWAQRSGDFAQSLKMVCRPREIKWVVTVKDLKSYPYHLR